VKPAAAPEAPSLVASNFIRHRIEADLASGHWQGRRWRGTPGTARDQAQAAADPARIRTRFPPEPNGYLHVGHAKSICLNFGLAQEFGGVCHLRLDDTNPTKEEQEYVDAIIDAVQWLGFSWTAFGTDHLYFASDHFGTLYEFAEALIAGGFAYVDSQSAEAMRTSRGTLTEPGISSPWRDRSPADNLRLLREMRDGQHAEGAHVLRAKIDMASPNLNLRDPVLYRIRHAIHHRTGDRWCVYPMYDFAHPISDALENITHSICTLEFEDHRPLYDWLLARLADLGCLSQPVPQQTEFARLNLTGTLTSKRKLQALVSSGTVSGWDDPRMPTLAGLRRRGYTPGAIRLFCERIGVARADSWIEPFVLEQSLRDDLDRHAPRTIAVLDPLLLVLEDWPEDLTDTCLAPIHPHHPELGQRRLTFGRKLWIEREDFAVEPPKGFFRLTPGARVRLRYGHVIECTGWEAGDHGQTVLVHARVLPDSKSGTPGADSYKVKGNIHWLPEFAPEAEIRRYAPLFNDPNPAARDDWLACLNPDSFVSSRARVEPAAAQSDPEQRFQFERHGYFVADRIDHQPGMPVFNQIVSLKDSKADPKAR
jgi:glutaminyl-tRNA synthetase